MPRLDGALGWRAPFIPELELAAAAVALAALAPPGRPVPVRRDASLRQLLHHPLVWRYGAYDDTTPPMTPVLSDERGCGPGGQGHALLIDV